MEGCRHCFFDTRGYDTKVTLTCRTGMDRRKEAVVQGWLLVGRGHGGSLDQIPAIF